MFKVFINAWKVQDIRKKLVWILFILAIYRLGAHIPLPGLNLEALANERQAAKSTADLLFSIIAGGGFGSILVLGIGPYITSSIIMQLLTVAIPALEKKQKEGEEGRKQIGQYTRIVAVFLATLQGAGTVYSYQSMFTHQNWLTYIIATLSLVTGTIFVMWLGEILTERGIGNGSSFIIFANIIANLPAAVIKLYTIGKADIYSVIRVVAVLTIFLLVIAFVILVQDGERRIPVQYSKKMVGRQMFGGQSSYIPIKVNIAGVMAIIFAISLLQFPSMIARLLPNPSETLNQVVRNIDINAPIGAILYIILIICFTFFYTSFAMNPIEMAENMKKSGGFIPGIRPGKPTSDYIKRTIDRLSCIGALAYSIIAITPVIMQAVSGIQVGFGGTTLLIVTGVCLEIVKQLEAQLLMRHYKGFLQ